MIRTIQQSSAHMEHVPGQLVLRVEEPAVRPQLGTGALTFSASGAKLLPASVADPIEYLRANAGLRAVMPLFSTRARALERASVGPSTRHRLAVLSRPAPAPSRCDRPLGGGDAKGARRSPQEEAP